MFSTAVQMLSMSSAACPIQQGSVGFHLKYAISQNFQSNLVFQLILVFLVNFSPMAFLKRLQTYKWCIIIKEHFFKCLNLTMFNFCDFVCTYVIVRLLWIILHKLWAWRSKSIRQVDKKYKYKIIKLPFALSTSGSISLSKCRCVLSVLLINFFFHQVVLNCLFTA